MALQTNKYITITYTFHQYFCFLRFKKKNKPEKWYIDLIIGKPLTYAMVWIFVPPPKKKISYVDILTSKIMVLGGGVFGRLLDHDSGSSQNWINTLIKGTPEN